MKCTEVEEFSQGHLANRWQNWNSSPDVITPEPALLSTAGTALPNNLILFIYLFIYF